VRRSHSTRRPRPGLSLIEVLLGLVIMLLSLVAVGRLVDIGTERSIEAQVQTRATRLAQSKMAEVESGALPLDSSSGGTFDPEEPDWSWSVEPQPAGPPNVYRVTVRVSRDVRGRPFEVSLSQVLFNPTMMGTAAQAEKPADTTGSGTTGTGTTTGTSGGMSP
jgi:general secretion pathway protein I